MSNTQQQKFVKPGLRRRSSIVDYQDVI